MANSRDDFEKSTRISQDINGRSNPNWGKSTTSSSGVRVANSDTITSKSTIVPNTYIPGSPTYSNNSTLVNMMADDSDMLQDFNIVDRYSVDWYNKFNRAGFLDPYNGFRKTKEYIFITKPDLHLFDNSYTINPELSNRSSFFNDALDRYKEVAMQLQYSQSSNRGPFMQLLSNAVNGPLELPSISAGTIETSKTVYGFSISYRGSSGSSDNDYDFSLEFKDSKFLEVYMLFKMYDEYERLKWTGLVTPNEKYIRNRVLHDQVSIYKFIVDADGMTILYFARAMGCIPLSVPRDSMSNIEGELTFSINWKAQYIYDMDPRILVDFNRITADYRSNMSNQNLPLFNSSKKNAEGRWSSCPYVMTRKDISNRKERFNKYYLFWTY